MSTPNPVPVVGVKDDTTKPYKAITATVLSFVGLVVAAWISDDNGVTTQEVVNWIISGLIGSGLVGAGTYTSKNPKVVDPSI